MSESMSPYGRYNLEQRRAWLAAALRREAARIESMPVEDLRKIVTTCELSVQTLDATLTAHI